MSQGTCRIEGCEKPVKMIRDSLCGTHYARKLKYGDAEAPVRPYGHRNGATCAVEGCERDARTRGWCGPHYQRWLKHGDPGPAEIYVQTVSTCTVEGCDRPHRAKGYCEPHYQRWQRTGDPGPVELQYKTPLPLVCTVDGCNDRARARGMCGAHYRQANTGDGTITAQKRKLAPAGSGTVNKDGYRIIRVNGKSRMEHRVIAERTLGRPLRKQEEVHHLDGNRARNVVDGPFVLNHRGNYVSGNLEIWSTSQPKGQEIGPKLAWAREMLALYGTDDERTRYAQHLPAYEPEEEAP